MIGSAEGGLDQDLEAVRTGVLSSAVEDENLLESVRSKLYLLGSLESGERGNILKGPLTDARFSAHEDYHKSLFPYIKWSKQADAQGSGEGVAEEPATLSEDEERKAFLESYNKYLAGETVESKAVYYKDPKD